MNLPPNEVRAIRLYNLNQRIDSARNWRDKADAALEQAKRALYAAQRELDILSTQYSELEACEDDSPILQARAMTADSGIVLDNHDGTYSDATGLLVKPVPRLTEPQRVLLQRIAKRENGQREGLCDLLSIRDLDSADRRVQEALYYKSLCESKNVNNFAGLVLTELGKIALTKGK